MNQTNIIERNCLVHSGEKVILVCFNENCKENRLICSVCLLKHSIHIKQIEDIDNYNCIQKLDEQCNQILSNYNRLADDLINSIQLIKQIILNKYQFFLENQKNELECFLIRHCKNHDKSILLICNNEKCIKNKFLCSDCCNDHNKAHLISVLDKQQFLKTSDTLFERFKKKTINLNIITDRMIQTLICFKQQLNYNYSSIIKDFMGSTNFDLSLKITQVQKLIVKNKELTLQTLNFFSKMIQQMTLNQNSFNGTQIQIQNGYYCSVMLKQNNFFNFDRILKVFSKCGSRKSELTFLDKGYILLQVMNQNFDKKAKII